MLSCDISSDDKYIVTGSGDKKATVYEVIYWKEYAGQWRKRKSKRLSDQNWLQVAQQPLGYPTKAPAEDLQQQQKNGWRMTILLYITYYIKTKKKEAKKCALSCPYCLLCFPPFCFFFFSSCNRASWWRRLSAPMPRLSSSNVTPIHALLIRFSVCFRFECELLSVFFY